MVNKHMHFAGATSFMMWLEERRKINGKMRSFGYGEEGRSDEGIDILLNGDETHVEEAQKLVETLALSIETPRNTWHKDVWGVMPDVPAYLAGDPMNMWNVHKVSEDRAPIRVFVGLTSSAMIGDEDLIKRGVALAAFAIAMANVRPVVITPFITLGSSSYEYRRRGKKDDDTTRNMLISWDISTQPLVLSEVMSLTRPEVTRYVGIEACRQLFGPIAADDPSFHHDSFSEVKMREHLGAQPNDLYLPVIHASDPILDDPVKWVNDTVAKYITGEATDIEAPTNY